MKRTTNQQIPKRGRGRPRKPSNPLDHVVAKHQPRVDLKTLNPNKVGMQTYLRQLALDSDSYKYLPQDPIRNQQQLTHIVTRICSGESLMSVCKSPKVLPYVNVIRWMMSDGLVRSQIQQARMFAVDHVYSDMMLEVVDSVWTNEIDPKAGNTIVGALKTLIELQSKHSTPDVAQQDITHHDQYFDGEIDDQQQDQLDGGNIDQV